jgi:hypothetical protein
MPTTLLTLIAKETEKHEIGVASSGIRFMLNFVRKCEVVQNLEGEMQTHMNTCVHTYSMVILQDQPTFFPYKRSQAEIRCLSLPLNSTYEIERFI